MQNSSFQFSNPYLLELTFGTNDNFHSSPDSPINIQLSYHINISRDPGRNEAFVTLTVSAGTEDSSNPFQIKATEGAKFRWDDDTDSNVDHLLKQNAPALLLGYLRPTIAMLTSASPFNAYNLPFIDFTK